MPRKTSTADKARIADRQALVLDLARQGYTYRQIAADQRVAVSHAQVARDFDAAIAEVVRPAAEQAKRLALLRATWVWMNASEAVGRARRASNDELLLKALDRCTRALERLAKLEGTDQPLRSEVSILSLDAIEAEIAQIEAALASGELGPVA